MFSYGNIDETGKLTNFNKPIMESVFITDPTCQSAAWMIRDGQGRDALRVWNVELKNDPEHIYLPHPTRPAISQRPVIKIKCGYVEHRIGSL